jgi:hypothetical protein
VTRYLFGDGPDLMSDFAHEKHGFEDSYEVDGKVQYVWVTFSLEQMHEWELAEYLSEEVDPRIRLLNDASSTFRRLGKLNTNKAIERKQNSEGKKGKPFGSRSFPVFEMTVTAMPNEKGFFHWQGNELYEDKSGSDSCLCKLRRDFLGWTF